MNRAGAFCVCVTATLLLSLLADAQVPTLVLEGGTLIDGKGGLRSMTPSWSLKDPGSSQWASEDRCPTRKLPGSSESRAERFFPG